MGGARLRASRTMKPRVWPSFETARTRLLWMRFFLEFRFNFQTAYRRHYERSEAIQGRTWNSGLLRRFAPRNDDRTQPLVLATAFARVLQIAFAQRRGRREDRVRAAPAVSCATLHIKKRTRAYRFSGGSPAFPAQWFYGLFRALPGDRACLPPSPTNCSVDLTPASGRQDHTASPSVVFVIRPRACARLT
jgi:hypothetical protein